MSGMLFCMRFLEGLYVEKKAHTMDAVSMNMNSFFGNVNGVGIPTNIDLYSVMPHPTQVPITTPEKELDRTSINASYMKSFMITLFVHPIDLITEISFTCSNKLPVIDDEREKKQMNIVMAMITLKINSSVFSAYKNKLALAFVRNFLTQVIH